MESGEDTLSVPTMLIAAGGLVFLAHLFQFVFQRFRVPETLWLIGIGLVVGPLTHFVQPEDFGIVGPALTAIALAVILFEAGLELHLRDLKAALGSAVQLTLVVYLASLVAVMLLVRILTGYPWITAVFVGAVIAAPAPTVILPMLRNSRIERNLKVTVTLESALGEALGLVVALAILRLGVSREVTAGHLIGSLLSSFIVATVIGLVAGIGWAFVLKQVRGLKHSMILTPSMVFILFGLMDYLEFSGPVAVLAFGLALGNFEGTAKQFKWLGDDVAPARVEKMELEFIGELVFLLKTFFFVFLGISMRPTDLWSPTALAIIGLLLLVRFVSVRFSLPGMISGGADGPVVASLIPKGLAAAVMAAAAAGEPDFPHGKDVDNLIYAVIFFSIATTAFLVFLFEKTRLHSVFSGWWFREP
jgi:NhaP-type Na+/H+ or K+/H+ antiporter